MKQTFKDDDFTRTHPTFLWAFRATRNWPVVKDLVPFMQNRLNSEGHAIQKLVSSRGGFTDKEAGLQTDFDTLFKHLFCVTAKELSDELRMPLQDMGTLYDDVLSTAIPVSRLSQAMGRSSLRTGKGQMMFTLRQLNKQEAMRLSSQGYRFATIEQVTGPLSRRIHVPEASLIHSLRDMRDYASTNRGFEEGVHLVSFVMRPTIHDHFEILTTKGVGNPLPSTTLPLKQLQANHLELLSEMEGWSMNACIRYLQSDAASSAFPDLSDFRTHLSKSITSLSKSLPEEMRSTAQLSARPLTAPCRSGTLSQEQSFQTCTLLSFCVVGTLDTQVPNPDYTFTPFRLFRVQQQANEAIADRDSFARELGHELFCTDVRSGPTDTDTDLSSTAKMAILRLWSSHKRPESSKEGSGSSLYSQDTLMEPAAMALRDITVHKEVRVDITRLNETSSQNVPSNRETRAISVGGDANMPATYVDELYSLCYSPGIRFRPDSSLRHISPKFGL